MTADDAIVTCTCGTPHRYDTDPHEWKPTMTDTEYRKYVAGVVERAMKDAAKGGASPRLTAFVVTDALIDAGYVEDSP